MIPVCRVPKERYMACTLSPGGEYLYAVATHRPFIDRIHLIDSREWQTAMCQHPCLNVFPPGLVPLCLEYVGPLGTVDRANLDSGVTGRPSLDSTHSFLYVHTIAGIRRIHVTSGEYESVTDSLVKEDFVGDMASSSPGEMMMTGNNSDTVVRIVTPQLPATECISRRTPFTFDGPVRMCQSQPGRDIFFSSRCALYRMDPSGKGELRVCETRDDLGSRERVKFGPARSTVDGSYFFFSNNRMCCRHPTHGLLECQEYSIARVEDFVWDPRRNRLLFFFMNHVSELSLPAFSESKDTWNSRGWKEIHASSSSETPTLFESGQQRRLNEFRKMKRELSHREGLQKSTRHVPDVIGWRYKPIDSLESPWDILEWGQRYAPP